MAEKDVNEDIRRLRNKLSLCIADVEAVRMSLMATLVSQYHILVRRGMRAIKDSVNKYAVSYGR